MSRSLCFLLACGAAACVTQPVPGSQVTSQLSAGLPSVWTEYASVPQPLGQEKGIAAFRDEALAKLVNTALEASPSLQIVTARLEEARALSRLARSGLKPVVSLSAQAGPSGDFGGGDVSESYRLGVTASWEADLWGRLSAETRAASSRERAAEADLLAARHALMASVAEAYFLAIEARLQTAVAERTYSALSETLGFVEVQYDRGLRSVQDIALIRADVASTKAQLEATRAAERDALRALKVLLGGMDTPSLSLSEDLPDLPSTFETALPADMLVKRPDLMAAEARVRSALYEFDSARAGELPRLTLSGSISSTEA